MYWMGYVMLKRKDSFQNRSIRLKVIYAHCTVGVGLDHVMLWTSPTPGRQMGQRSAGGRELPSCHWLPSRTKLRWVWSTNPFQSTEILLLLFQYLYSCTKYKDDLWVRVGIVLVARNLSELLGRGRSSLCSYCCVNSRNSFTPLSFG